MKLNIVEQNALPIWLAFQKHYGIGFFNKMIEKEFGINPDTHEEIGNKFGEEVNNIRIDVNNKFEQIRKEIKSRIEMYQDTIRKLRKGANFKKHDEEKQELYEHIKLLETRIDTSKDPYKKYRPNVHDLINNISSDELSPMKQKPMTKMLSVNVNTETEKIKRTENWPQANQGAIDQLREENLNIIKELQNMKYLNSVAEKDYERVKEKLKSYANEIVFLKETNHKLRIESDNHEKQLKSIKLSNKETKEYSEVLESERSYLKSQIENMLKLIPKHKLNQIDKQSPFSIINMQTHKAKHQAEQHYSTMITGLFRDSQVHIAISTDLFGLDKEIVNRADIRGNIEIPMYDRDIQVEAEKPETHEFQAITDTTMEHIQNLEVQLKKLKDQNFKLEKEMSELHDIDSENSENIDRLKARNSVKNHSSAKLDPSDDILSDMDNS